MIRKHLKFNPSRHGEMADARDLKSLGRQLPCGFESRCRQCFLIPKRRQKVIASLLGAMS